MTNIILTIHPTCFSSPLGPTRVSTPLLDPRRLPFMIEYLMSMNRDPLYAGLAWDITINNSGVWNQIESYWGVITNLTLPEKYKD